MHAPLRDDGAYVTIRGASVLRVRDACSRGDIFTGDVARARSPPSLQCVRLAPIPTHTCHERGDMTQHYMHATNLTAFMHGLSGQRVCT